MTADRPTFTTATGGQFVLIEPGTFAMGCDSHGASPCESPIREVEISEPYFIAMRPVTQAEWVLTMKNNPSKFTAGLESGLRPVESISWLECIEYIAHLNENGVSEYLGIEGRFRLPSEAEWEYAARAGTSSPWSFEGSDRNLSEHGWHAGNSAATTQMVGQKTANPWGIFDFHGLVREWCLDLWHDDYLGAPTDQSPWLEGGISNLRVHRGGSWFHESFSTRSSARSKSSATHTSDGLGLRLVWAPI